MYACCGCGMTSTGITFPELQEDGWSARRTDVNIPGKLAPVPTVLYFCGEDCRSYVLEDMDIHDHRVSAQAERIMRGE